VERENIKGYCRVDGLRKRTDRARGELIGELGRESKLQAGS
jgi:hypothetical protein